MLTAHSHDPTAMYALLAARLVLLALGVATTLIAFRAYRETGSRYLRDAAFGLGAVTVGVFIEGILYEVVGLPLAIVHLVETVAIAIGFIALLRSFLN